jgi:hypothetical protein
MRIYMGEKEQESLRLEDTKALVSRGMARLQKIFALILVL